MRKTLITSVSLTLIALLVMRVVPYFEGFYFDKYWQVPMGLLPLALLSFIVFFVSSIIVSVQVVRKKKSKYNLVFVGAFFLLALLVCQSPFPTYVDGMKKRIIAEISREELISFANEANSRELDWVNYDEHSTLIEELREKHTKVLSLSSIPPRIEKGKKYISVFYGSALVKHWGYVVGEMDEFPIEHIPKDMQRQVYKGVWVYHDIW
jgi:hypothetical protein